MCKTWITFCIFLCNVVSEGYLIMNFYEILYKISQNGQFSLDFHRQLDLFHDYGSTEISIFAWNCNSSTSLTKPSYSQTIEINVINNKCNNLNYAVEKLSYTLKISSPRSVILEEAYRVRDKLIRNTIKLIDFKSVGYELVFPSRRRQNFNGATIPVLTYELERVIGQVDPRTGIITGARAAESIMRDLQFISNFKITLRIFSEKEVPLTTNNYFANVVQQLDANSADLAIGYFNIRQDRVALVSPLVPIMAEGIYAFFSQPDTYVMRNIYLETIHPSAIYIYVALMFGIGIYCYIYVVKTSKQNSDLQDNHISQIIVLVSALVTQRSFGSPLINNTVFLMASFVSILVFAVYSAKLLTALRETVYPVNSIEDLMHQDFTFHSMPAARSVVFNDTKRRLRRREKNFEETSIPAIFQERHVMVDVGFNTINGFSWFIRNILDPPLSDREICAKLFSIQFLNSNLFMSSTFYVKKNSPLRGIFNNQIREVGFLKKYMKFTNMETTSLGCDPVFSLRYKDDLGLKDVSEAFVLICVAMLVSNFVFIAERSLFHIMQLYWKYFEISKK